MQRKHLRALLFGALLLVATTGAVAAQSGPSGGAVPGAASAAVSTAFSYQGQLKRGGSPFTGACTLQVSLWDAAAAGTQKGSTLTLNNVAVTAGAFTVELDFGNQFTGDARWLQTAVRCAGDAGFTTLSPRTLLTGTPYALSLRPGAAVRNAAGGDSLNTSSIDGYGVTGDTQSGYAGIYGTSANSYGVYGVVNGAAPRAGVFGRNNGAGFGMFGQSESGAGGFGLSKSGEGLAGDSGSSYGVTGRSQTGYAGVYGTSDQGYGMYGLISGESPRAGIFGRNLAGSGFGVFGQADAGIGVFGMSASGTGVYGRSATGLAGDFDGRVRGKVVEITGGADLAERFQVSGDVPMEPGALMIIDDANPGHLKPSATSYDSKVAGVVSGAGGVQPGLTLHQEGVMEGDTVIAIAGRVYVKAEAQSASIRPGDLLTTSDLPGHAMRASDSSRSHGAVIGKAMTGLDRGTGLVLVLVNLQ